MPQTLHDLTAEALELPFDEREILALKLLDSLDPEPPALSQEWIDEIERRSQAIERGEVELLDGDEVMARLRARFAR